MFTNNFTFQFKHVLFVHTPFLCFLGKDAANVSGHHCVSALVQDLWFRSQRGFLSRSIHARIKDGIGPNMMFFAGFLASS